MFFFLEKFDSIYAIINAKNKNPGRKENFRRGFFLIKFFNYFEFNLIFVVLAVIFGAFVLFMFACAAEIGKICNARNHEHDYNYNQHYR